MSKSVPEDWMPDCVMQRIHVHWTGGGYSANSTDKNAYHILIQGDGSLVRGNKTIDANASGSVKEPASHTWKANTGAIGVSICAMVGAEESPYKPGPAPITDLQWRTMIDVVAQLSIRYGVLVTSSKILTHAEVEPNLGIKQKNKWDITRLEFDKGKVGYKAVGDKMRIEVAAAKDGAIPPVADSSIPDEMKLPKYRVSGVSPSTLNFRRSPDGEKVGELSEGTRVELISRLGEWSQVRTPAGYVGWVATEYLVLVGST
jgi:hypothetical protein